MLVTSLTEQVKLTARRAADMTPNGGSLGDQINKQGDYLLSVRDRNLAAGGTTDAIDADLRKFIAQAIDAVADASPASMHAETVFKAMATHGTRQTTTGTDQADLLIGTGETVTGGAGDDVILGGTGRDVAVFSGNFADYDVTTDGEFLKVAHKDGGADGTDHVLNVATLRFADMDVAVVTGSGSSGGGANETVPTGGAGATAGAGDTAPTAEPAPEDGPFTVARNGVDGSTGYLDVIATATVADPTDGETYSYSLSDDAGGLFEIDSATGEISLKQAEPEVMSRAILHLDASREGAGLQGTLDDQSNSANQNNATQNSNSRRAEMDVGAMNGFQALKFDGGDLYQIRDHEEFNAGSRYDAKSGAVTFKAGDDIESRQVIYEQGGRSNGLNVYVDDDKVYAGIWSSSTGWDGQWLSADIEAGQDYALSFSYDGDAGTFTAWLNGKSLGAASVGSQFHRHTDDAGVGGAQSQTKFADGGTSTSNVGFQGHIGEVLMWNEALATDDQAALDQHLRAKWVGDVGAAGVGAAGAASVTVVATDSSGDAVTQTISIAEPVAPASGGVDGSGSSGVGSVTVAAPGSWSSAGSGDGEAATGATVFGDLPEGATALVTQQAVNAFNDLRAEIEAEMAKPEEPSDERLKSMIDALDSLIGFSRQLSAEMTAEASASILSAAGFKAAGPGDAPSLDALASWSADPQAGAPVATDFYGQPAGPLSGAKSALKILT